MPKGIGTYKLACSVHGKKTYILLPHTLYNPEGGVNLISSTFLQSRGIYFLLHPTGAIALSGSRISFTATMRKRLLFLDTWKNDNATAVALAAYSVSSPGMRLWHERLGHLGQDNLKKLLDMSTGMRPIPESHLCEPCAEIRLKESPHKGELPRGSYPLESLHMDVCGPFRTTGYDNSRYWLTIVCGFTNMTWAIPLKDRSKVFTAIQEFLDANERPERRCHFIRLDKAGEFISTELRLYCTTKGIELSHAPTEQHQSNGIAERANRIIEERLTGSMRATDLPYAYWSIVLSAVVYLRNLTPNERLGKTPYEAWFNTIPDLAHLRVIGSRGFYLLPEQQRKRDGKLSSAPISRPCRLLAYKGMHNYIVLTDSGRILTTNNVIFDETTVFKDMKRT